MEFYRRDWFKIGGVLFVGLTFILAFCGGTLDPLRLILIYSFMALLAHQVEEYGWPGGFPSIFNIAVMNERQAPDRYPLNASEVLVVNVVLGYPLYIVPIIFPQFVWLGIAQVSMGMLQILIHGVIINIKLKSLYNPGLATVLFLHFPIGLYYMWYVITHGLATPADFLVGIALAIVAGGLTIVLPMRLMGDRNSPYPFPDAVLYGYAREKLEHMLRAG
jgi:hypothetical protein